MSQNNQERIQQIWSEIAQWEAQKTAGVSLQTQEQIDRDIKAAKKEISELEIADQAAEQAEREQQIEDKVASIELPYDFNDLYENSTANDTIIEIVQQFKRQDLVEHNVEVQQLKDEIRAANDREMQLQRQNKTMQNDLLSAHENFEELKSKNAELDITISELQLELQDVRQSRDNAAVLIDEQKMEIERLNSHIDDLVKEQAVGARDAHKVIEASQTLSELIEKANAEKQAKIKSAAEVVLENGIPFRGKVEIPEIKQQELPFQISSSAEFTSNQLLSAEASAPVEVPIFQTVSAPDVQGVSAPVVESTSSDTGTSGETPITSSQLESRLAEFRKEILSEVTGEKVA